MKSRLSKGYLSVLSARRSLSRKLLSPLSGLDEVNFMNTNIIPATTTMVVNSGDIIYNYLTDDYDEERTMMNFHNKKTKQIVSAVIIAILVLAMVVPTLMYLVS